MQGELFQRGHILLQFTGMYDQQEVEIYEMDVLVKHDQNTWYVGMMNITVGIFLTTKLITRTILYIKPKHQN